MSPGVGILNRISCCCFLFLLPATDELLHLQSRQDRADPALRVEPTKLLLVLQVCNKQEFSLSYRISLICSSSMNSAHSYITNMFLFLPQLRCCQQTYWWQAIPSCSQQGSAEINPLIPCTWSCTPANQAHKIAGFVVIQERQELAERVMVTRLHLYGKWIKVTGGINITASVVCPYTANQPAAL